MTNAKGPITLTVLGVLFVVSVFVGFQLLTAPADDLVLDSPSDEPTCKARTLKPGDKLAPLHVDVNVYNAGSISGLANQTMKALGDKGFRAGEVGNAPKGVSARNVTLISNSPKSPQVKLLTKQFKGSVRVVKAADKHDESLSVVIGDKFRGVAKKAPGKERVKRRIEVCVPIEASVEQ